MKERTNMPDRRAQVSALLNALPFPLYDYQREVMTAILLRYNPAKGTPIVITPRSRQAQLREFRKTYEAYMKAVYGG